MQEKPLLAAILNSQYFGVLNTVGDNQPYSSLVSFAATEDLDSLVFVTERGTRKYRNMQDNPAISLLVDNRTNRISDISEATAVTAIGTIHEEPDNESIYRDMFLTKHPGLRRFIDSPDAAVIIVTVREYIIAGFKKTRRIILDP